MSNFKYNPKLVFRFSNRSQLKPGRECVYLPFIKDNDIPEGTICTVNHIESGDKVIGNNTALIEDTRMISLNTSNGEPFVTSLMNLSDIDLFSRGKRRRSRPLGEKKEKIYNNFLKGWTKLDPIAGLKVVTKDPIFKEDFGCEVMIVNHLYSTFNYIYPYTILGIRVKEKEDLYYEALDVYSRPLDAFYSKDCTKIDLIEKREEGRVFKLDDCFIYDLNTATFSANEKIQLETFFSALITAKENYPLFIDNHHYRQVHNKGLISYLLGDITHITAPSPQAVIAALMRGDLLGEDPNLAAEIAEIKKMVETLKEAGVYSYTSKPIVNYGVKVDGINKEVYTIAGITGVYERFDTKTAITNTLNTLNVAPTQIIWRGV